MHDSVTITILHSNDIHGDFDESQKNGDPAGGLARLSGYVRRIRQEEKNVIYAMAGDLFMGSIIDTEYRGFSTIRLANALEPDVFEIGNHELDYGLSHLLFLEKCADFPVICGNLYVRELNRRLFSAWCDVERDGVKIRFIGLLTESIAGRISQEDIIDKAVRVTPPLWELERIVREVSDDPADINILLSHLGIEDDLALAEGISPDWGIDLIIGGHSHTYMEEPRIVSGIPVVQAGFGSRQAGRFDIIWDRELGRIAEWKWKVEAVNGDSCEEDPLVSFYLDRFQTETDRKYDQVLFSMSEAVELTWYHRESTMLDMFTDIFRECFSTDIFLLSTNVLRMKKLGPEVTRRDLMTALPYDNEIFELSLPGKSLEKMLRHMYRSEAWEGANVFFILSGSVKLTVRKSDKEILSMEYRGKPVEEERRYTVGINTYAFRNLEEFLGVSLSGEEDQASIRRLCSNDKEELETFFLTHERFELRDTGRLTLI